MNGKLEKASHQGVYLGGQQERELQEELGTDPGTSITNRDQGSIYAR